MSYFSKIFAVLSVLSWSSLASSMDLSVASGLFKTSSSKSNGTDTGGQTEISAQARLMNNIDANLSWIGEAGLILTSYKAPSGSTAPSNHTGIRIGGGARYYFEQLGKGIWPFADGIVSYRNIKVEKYVESSGVFYEGIVGMRFSLTPTFFLEIACPLFDSALFANRKTEITTTTTAGETTTKSEESSTEIFAQNHGNLTSSTVSLGLRF